MFGSSNKQLFHIMLIAAFLILIVAGISSACEIEVKIKGKQKEVYTEGEMIVLSVCVFMTHKDCPEGIEATKFKSEGIKVLGATKWKETAPLKFVRLFKVKIEKTDKGECVFHTRRTCDKDENGGYGFLRLKGPSVELAAK